MVETPLVSEGRRIVMCKHVPWVERTFSFDFPAGQYRELLERLRGAPARVEDRTRALPANVLTLRPGSKWSIQEHVGHLVDVESLFSARLDEFEAGAEVLRAADMSNRATEEARHNERVLTDIFRDFRRERGTLVARLEALPPDFFARGSLHPRLKRPMRLADMLLFQAEHDDYHMARITELIQALL
jgi:uncharacterized damage-inducible protein DinB